MKTLTSILLVVAGILVLANCAPFFQPFPNPGFFQPFPQFPFPSPVNFDHFSHYTPHEHAPGYDCGHSSSSSFSNDWHMEPQFEFEAHHYEEDPEIECDKEADIKPEGTQAILEPEQEKQPEIEAATEKVEAATEKVEAATEKVEAATEKVEAATEKVDAATEKVEVATEKEESPQVHHLEPTVVTYNAGHTVKGDNDVAHAEITIHTDTENGHTFVQSSSSSESFPNKFFSPEINEIVPQNANTDTFVVEDTKSPVEVPQVTEEKDAQKTEVTDIPEISQEPEVPQKIEDAQKTDASVLQEDIQKPENSQQTISIGVEGENIAAHAKFDTVTNPDGPEMSFSEAKSEAQSNDRGTQKALDIRIFHNSQKI